MSRYIEADAVITAIAEFNKYEDELEYPYASDDLEEYKDDARLLIEDAPSIDLADYVPKDFHDKTCEAMAKRHQEEIADMVRVVRCKECVHGTWHEQTEMYICSANDQDLYEAEHFCSYGERKDKEITTDCSWK